MNVCLPDSVASLCAAALLTVACGGGSTSAPGSQLGGAPALVTLDGSSTVFPISEAVAEEFQKANPGTRVTVGISGTGGGFQKFCRGETDISDASRPISATEIEACGKTRRRVHRAAGRLRRHRDRRASRRRRGSATSRSAELKKLWAPEAQGKVTRWNQVRTAWPDREIHLFGAGVDSGTYDYFTEAINGKAKASRGDYTSSEDDNVLVQGVSSDELALGFIPFAYYEENQDKLKLVPVDDGKADNGDGPILPSAETIRTGTYQPLSRPLFIYVSDEGRRAARGPEVRRVLPRQGRRRWSREVGYVGLGDAAYQLVGERFARPRDRIAVRGRPSTPWA